MISIERIKRESKKQGYTQESLADAIGVSRNSVSKWFIGLTNPTMARYEQLLELLGLDDVSTTNGINIGSQKTKHGSIITGNTGAVHSNVNVNKSATDSHNADAVPSIPVPVLSYVQAGEFTNHPEQVQPMRYELMPASSVPKGAFLLDVIGNSMNYDHSEAQILNRDYDRFSIEEGEQVLVDPSELNISNLVGKVIVAKNGDGTTVKLVYQEEKGICLMPLNSRFQNDNDIKKPSEATVIGRVVQVMRIKRF